MKSVAEEARQLVELTAEKQTLTLQARLAKEKADLEQLQKLMADRQQRLAVLQEEMAKIHNTINYTAGKVAVLDELLGGGGEES